MQVEMIRVALIDGNDEDAQRVERALANAPGESFVVHRLTTLDAALRFLSSRQVDALVVDVQLGDCQGLDVLPRLQESSPEVPLVVHTALDDERLVWRALEVEGVEGQGAKFTVNLPLLPSTSGIIESRAVLTSCPTQGVMELDLLT